MKSPSLQLQLTSTLLNCGSFNHFMKLLQAGVPGKQFDLFQEKPKFKKSWGSAEVEATIPNLSTSPRLQQESSVSQGMLPKGASKEPEMQYIPVRDAQEGLSYMMCLWFLWLGEKTGEIVFEVGGNVWNVAGFCRFFLYRIFECIL